MAKKSTADAVAAADITTPQQWTSEQREQARKNIADIQFEWHQLTKPNVVVADYGLLTNKQTIDFEAAMELQSVTYSYHKCLSRLADRANQAAHSITAINATTAQIICKEYDNLVAAGCILSTSVRLCVKEVGFDKIGAAFSVEAKSGTYSGFAYTHMIQMLIGGRVGTIRYNINTNEAQSSLVVGDSLADKTLTLESLAADAKATGDALALKADDADVVHTPATASVGQTIVVKSVDDSGKPTEWECADMASGSAGGETYETFTVVAEGGESWIGFTWAELGIAHLRDCSALMLWGHCLGLQSETLTGAQCVCVKVKPENSAAYGLIFGGTSNLKVASVGENLTRNHFATVKIVNTERDSTHDRNSVTSAPPTIVWSGANVKESANKFGTEFLAPLDDPSWYKGTGVWCGPVSTEATFMAGATFSVRIWR